ncbi:MAG: hypothetical protein Q4B69_00645 [Slackia sp.]|nr:hypothetical protein [Slackia sp.]
MRLKAWAFSLFFFQGYVEGGTPDESPAAIPFRIHSRCFVEDACDEGLPVGKIAVR